MYEKLETCPSCKHTSFNNFLICKDYLTSQESFAIVKCSKCHLVFTNPRPDQDNIGRFYQSDQYISHTNSGNSAINLIYKLIRRYTTHTKIKHIKKYMTSGRLLDYGCGTGFFLSKTKNFEIFGFEPDKDARDIAEKTAGIEVYGSTTQIKKAEKFDIITAWHVIEHVHQLTDTIKLLKKKLNPKGVMFIALPNLSSYDAIKYGASWAAYDVPRHLYHFNQQSFLNLIKKNKLHLIETLPMHFDSYYVSLLSERNLSGGIIPALKTAYTSNRQAKKDGNYSSLIYVVGK